MQAVQLPIEGIDVIPLRMILDSYMAKTNIYSLDDYDFDHVVVRLSENMTSRELSDLYVESIEKLDIMHKNMSNL